MYRINKSEITENIYNWQALMLQLLLLPVVLLAVTALLFFATVPITVFHFPVSVAATIGISYLIVRKHNSFRCPEYSNSCSFWKVTIVFVFLILAAMFIAMPVYDFSNDGQAFHQPAVIALANGWNPFHQPFIENFDPFYKSDPGGYNLFIDHSTKASWITAAAIYKVTGSLESGKLFNILFLFAVFLTTWNFLFHFGRIPWKSRFTIAALVTLNPVSLYQLFTFYNDSQLAALISITLIFVFQYIMFREEKVFIPLSLALVTLCNIKITGMIYGGAIIIMAWLAVFIIDRKIQRKFFLTVSAAFIIAFIFIGFQPYMTNLLHKGNPFYPASRLVGSQVAPLNISLSKQAPEAFIETNRFRKLFLSIFSNSDNNPNNIPQLKIPFAIHDNEMAAFNRSDARYGGFGPLFGSVLVMVLLAGFFVFFKTRKVVMMFCFIPSLVILILTLINPEAWWARLSPQMWLLPITFIASFYYFPNEYLDYFRAFIITVLLLNSVLVMTRHSEFTLTVNYDFRNQMAALHNEAINQGKTLIVYPDKFLVTARNRLDRFKIPYIIKNQGTAPQANGQSVFLMVGNPGIRMEWSNGQINKKSNRGD